MLKPRWTQEEIGYLRQFYPFIPAAELAELFDGRPTKAITAKAARIGVQKCPERLREMGRMNVSVRWEHVRSQQAQAGI